MFNNLYGKKQFKKDKLYELNISEETVRKYAEKETEKTFTKVDTLALLKDLVVECECPQMTISDYIKYQLEHLGYIEYVNPELTSRHIAVTELNTT